MDIDATVCHGGETDETMVRVECMEVVRHQQTAPDDPVMGMQMDDTPLFSVLIANHNGGRYLMDAIASVRAQTYSNWEIILVDDASADNSGELYRELGKDSRIHVFSNGERKGCGHTKRRCADLAHGALCGFLDSDDALAPGALETMVREHRKHREASLVYSTHFCCDERLRVQHVSKYPCAIPEGMTFLEYGKGAVSHFAVFKTDRYRKTAGISPDLTIAEDHDLYFKLEEVGAIRFIPEALYYYRTGTGSNTSLGENALRAQFWDYVGMMDACRRRNLSIEDVVVPQFVDSFKQHIALVDRIYRSKTYRVGALVTWPYRFLKSFFRKRKIPAPAVPEGRFP